MSAITYECPNCGGGLVFDPESGMFTCEYCLSKFEEAELAGKKQSGEETKDAAETAEAQEQSALVYHCPSCGAEVMTDETTAATFCFYCHNPIVLSGKLEGKYLPDGVIPFKISKDEAMDRFRQWIEKKWFIPGGFYSPRQIEKMSGVYFPYWLCDCESESTMSGTARDIRIWRVGDTEYTETKTFAVRRSGTLKFRHIPKTALQKAQNAMLKGIFPYEFGALEKFHMGYLSGFQAEKRDIESDTLNESVDSEVRGFAEKRIRDTISGHNSFDLVGQEHKLGKKNFQYVLLPVWVLTYRERGNQVYYFAMNGQTGEIIGKLPVDRKKMAILSAVIFLAVFGLLLLGGFLL